ncbi:MAG: hypothetical protein N2202_00180 [Proteobacteria bacterium]|nr:hypothetical protein [Pseudomonadota bacterium]
MVINKVLTTDKLPEFIQYFFTSKYIAYWLGIKITQIDEIREYAIENILDIENKFLRIIFADYQVKELENNLDDRLKVEDIADFVRFIIDYYDDIEDFLAEREESFYVEFVFQVPFIWNSRFSKEERETFFSDPKAKYYATIRNNYIGRMILIKSSLDIIDTNNDECLVQFYFEDQGDLDLLLLFPKFLKKYWVTIIDRIVKSSGYSIPFEISDC